MKFDSFDDVWIYVKKKLSREHSLNRFTALLTVFFILVSLSWGAYSFGYPQLIIAFVVGLIIAGALIKPFQGLKDDALCMFLDDALSAKERFQTHSGLTSDDERKLFISKQLLALSSERVKSLSIKKINYSYLIASSLLLLVVVIFVHPVTKNTDDVVRIETLIKEHEEELPKEVKQVLNELKEVLKKNDISSEEVREGLKKVEETMQAPQSIPTPTPTPTPTPIPTATQSSEKTKNPDKNESSSASKNEDKQKNGSGNKESKEQGEGGEKSQKDQKGTGEGNQKNTSKEGKKEGEGKNSGSDAVKKLIEDVKKKSEKEGNGQQTSKDKKESEGGKEDKKEDKGKDSKEGQKQENKDGSQNKEQNGKEGDDGKPDSTGEKEDAKKPDDKKDPEGKDSQSKNKEGKNESKESNKETEPQESLSDKAKKSSGEQGQRPDEKESPEGESRKPEHIKDVELPGSEEKINLDTLTGEENKVKNNEEAQYKTDLSHVKKEKSDAVTDSSQQFVPPEYEEYF